MRLAQILETEGGRILAAFVFLILAGVWNVCRLPKGDELVIAASTLIARELMGSSSRIPPQEPGARDS